MTDQALPASGQVPQEAIGESLSLPSLADLDPIANFIAMRFALAGVSTNKVLQLSEVLHYHCLQMEGSPPRLAFELSKLTGWLVKSRDDFKDDDALEVLQATFNWYDRVARKCSDPSPRLRIKRSISDFVAVMTWKYKSFEVGRHSDKRRWLYFERPKILGLKSGDQEVKIYNLGRGCYTTTRLHTESVQLLQQYCHKLQPVITAIVQIRNLDQAIAIRHRLDTAIGDLGVGWRARLAIGIQMVQPLSQ
jgi:hypothetical protein